MSDSNILPTIDEVLNYHNDLQPELSVDHYETFDFVFIKIDETDDLTIRKSHLVEDVRLANRDSILVKFEGIQVQIYHISDRSIKFYQADRDQGLKFTIDMCVCQDWFVLDMNVGKMPGNIDDYFQRMQMFPDQRTTVPNFNEYVDEVRQRKVKVYGILQGER